MAVSTLRDLFLMELRDLYSAEKQILKALPKMAKAAASEELREAFEQHRQQTEGHVDRLEQIFSRLDEKPTGKKCVGLQGIIEEGSELMEEDAEPEVLNAGLIAGAQKVEHYEMAAYGTVRNYAHILGDEDAAELLQQTLDEERETDQKLTRLAEQINISATHEEDEGAEEESGGQERSNGARRGNKHGSRRAAARSSRSRTKRQHARK